jgi:hypothetical protein
MKTQNSVLTRTLIVYIGFFCSSLYAEYKPNNELETIYSQVCYKPCDINEHIPVLKKLSQECSSTVEIGIRGMVSTWGVLLGLSENESPNKFYLRIDLDPPPANTLAKAKELAELNGISFDFWQENDMYIEIPPTELLFIDSLHTYCHLTYELEKFSPNVSKYIVMHDTSAPWGNKNDSAYSGDYSEYPEWYNKTKQGLWPAVQDFLDSHPEWVLHERLFNNHGFTILKRVENEQNDLSLSNATIAEKYEYYSNNQDSYTSVHLPLISELVSECSTVTEIGVKSLGLTWGILNGLKNAQASTNYLSIGTKAPRSINELELAKALANENGIDYTFWKANDLFIQIEPTEILLLDTLQTYCHLTYELETFAKNVGKHICVFHTSKTIDVDDPLYTGDYSEYPAAYDKTKRGVMLALHDFLALHPEWKLLENHNHNQGLVILTRCGGPLEIKRLDDPEVQFYLDNKIILCTGPALNRYDMLKESTESDLCLINFKKIFVSTNDINILGITFKNEKPDSCMLLENRGKQYDCLNCIITTMKAAVNDPDVLDDDILMFKHESVFINDMGLVKRLIRKMLDGSDMITRTGMFGICTDHFFVKVSAVKEIVKDYPIVDYISYCCEDTFKEIIVDRIANIYNVRFNHSLWRFTQLGAYHYYHGMGVYNSEVDGWNIPWWDKRNYENLFN